MKPITKSYRQFTPTLWSGGKTTELFIHPPLSKYSERDFDFRLSTATVEVKSSAFTPLYGISRTLMVLDGEMTLSHEGHHTIRCGKFEVDRFDGGWNTSSAGKCTDFNLMTRGRTSGTLEGLVIKAGEAIQYSLTDVCDQFFLYVYMGDVSVMINNLPNTLTKGDLLVMHPFENPEMTINGIKNSELVICKITH